MDGVEKPAKPRDTPVRTHQGAKENYQGDGREEPLVSQEEGQENVVSRAREGCFREVQGIHCVGVADRPHETRTENYCIWVCGSHS